VKPSFVVPKFTGFCTDLTLESRLFGWRHPWSNRHRASVGLRRSTLSAASARQQGDGLHCWAPMFCPLALSRYRLPLAIFRSGHRRQPPRGRNGTGGPGRIADYRDGGHRRVAWMLGPAYGYARLHAPTIASLILRVAERRGAAGPAVHVPGTAARNSERSSGRASVSAPSP
jgi:hypothetical protein